MAALRHLAGAALQLAAILLLASAAVPATAHGPLPVRPEELWLFWNPDPLVLAPLVIAQWLYGRGIVRLWTRAGRGRGVTYANVVSFICGGFAVIVALVSPLDPLGGTLLAAHMAQHALLVTVAPLLLLLGKPGVAFAYGLRPDRRKALLASRPWRAFARVANAVSRPLPAATLHGLALWLWHAPGAFEAALESEWIHTLEHASFFGTALLFWRAILLTRSARQAASAIGAAFATLMHGGLLASLITLSPVLLYGFYRGRSELWGWSPLEDQQVAGLLMWVPMGAVYLGTCLFLTSRLVRSHAGFEPDA